MVKQIGWITDLVGLQVIMSQFPPTVCPTWALLVTPGPDSAR